MMRRTKANLIYSAWDLLWIKLDQIRSTLHSQISLRFQGCPPEQGLTTSGSCRFKARHAESIVLGRNVTLLAAWRSNRVGMSGPLLLHTLEDGIIRIGDRSGASSVVISARKSVRIGKDVKLGGNVRIFDHDFHSLDHDIRSSGQDTQNVRSKQVLIGDSVFVGANSIILKGVSLGERCIVGAGSVVTKSFPSDSIIAGNPAIQLTQRT